jgi:hypothetical protein
MDQKVTLTSIPASSVVYDEQTGLFVFSPRMRTDADLVDRLKRSMAETGMWQPIVVRADTMEGIAGNHRFLAQLELAEDAGLRQEHVGVMAVVVSCDEGLAVTIALAENEMRRDLTDWETVRALVAASKAKPNAAEVLFDVDGQTVEQLSFWQDQLAQDAEEQRREQRTRLTREWPRLINSRLAEYPDLHARFMEPLRHPSWVRARSLDELDAAITRSLVAHGIRFERGQTWNEEPHSKCLAEKVSFEELQEAVRMQEVMLEKDGVVAGLCPYLRVFALQTPRFVPSAAGSAVLQVAHGGEGFPVEALVDDGMAVQGENVLLLDDLEAYCVAPDVHRDGSCFQTLEAEAARADLERMKGLGLPAVLPPFLRDVEARGEFVWRCPHREGAPCTPQSCPYAGDDGRGLVVVLRPGERLEGVCLNAECGREAQEALVDWEAEERRREAERRRAAVDELRRVTVERTLLATEGDEIGMGTRAFLETLEGLLVPEWDTQTMEHVVIGWQRAMRGRLAEELGVSDAETAEVTRVFRDRHATLALPAESGHVAELFALLRTEVVRSETDLRHWIACLAMVRSWRDTVQATDAVSDAVQRLMDL